MAAAPVDPRAALAAMALVVCVALAAGSAGATHSASASAAAAAGQLPNGTIITSTATAGGGSRLIDVGAVDGRRDPLGSGGDPAVRDVSPAWSERPRHLAFLRFAREEVSLVVVDAGGRIQRRIALGPVSARTARIRHIVTGPQWSPDGRNIVLEQRVVDASGLDPPKSRILLVDPRRGTTSVLARGSSPTFLGNARVAFVRQRWHLVTEMGGARVSRPDGAQLLTIGIKGGAAEVLHTTDKDLPPSGANAELYAGAVGSLSGERVALTVGDDQGAPWDLLLVDRLGRVQWPAGGTEGPDVIAWSPNGDRLALVEGDDVLVSDGRRQRLLPAMGSRLRRPTVWAVAWSPDGRLLAALSCRFFAGRCEISRLRLGDAHWRQLTHVYLREGSPTTLVWRR